MKPLTIDKFKVMVVFELEKDKPFENSEKLRKKIKAKYGLNCAEQNELSRLIINHQVKNNGASLNSCFHEARQYKRTDSVYKRKVHR